MPLPTFFTLRDWCIEHDYLHPTRHILVEEQLAIFLKIVGENASNRMAQERFQRSGATISRVFNKVLDAITMLYPTIVTQPNGDTIPLRIRKDPKMFPYFKGCIGAADGTHIRAHIAESDAVRFRSRKERSVKMCWGYVHLMSCSATCYQGGKGITRYTCSSSSIGC